jgi:hypothetical protein
MGYSAHGRRRPQTDLNPEMKYSNSEMKPETVIATPRTFSAPILPLTLQPFRVPLVAMKSMLYFCHAEKLTEVEVRQVKRGSVPT